MSSARFGRFSPAAATVALVLVVGIGLASCSNSSSDGAAPKAKGPTTTAAPGSTAGGGANGKATTTSGLAKTPSSTTTPKVEPGEKAFTGEVPGQSTDAAISFVRGTDTIRSFAVQGLVVTCRPLKGYAEERTETIDIAIPNVAVAADGTVDYVGKEKYLPKLVGNFTAQGRFSGGLTISYEQDGWVCGGEYSFVI